MLKVLLILLVVVGIWARFYVTKFGYNYDTVSYMIVADLAYQNKNVYTQTDRYNYAPGWYLILKLIKTLSYLSYHPNFQRYAIISLLTLVDLGISYIILQRFGILKALLYFLNPISIIITGFHNQFDNLAILTALTSIFFLEKAQIYPKLKYRLIGLSLLGLSLIVKHIFFLFPVWLAIREKRFGQKIITLVFPIIIFIFSFLPFYQQGSKEIAQNVFNYRGFQNAPFYNLYFPGILKPIISPDLLFIIILVIGGIIFRKASLFDSLLFYCGLLFISAPAIANQYFVIALLLAICRINVFYLIFIVLASLHLLVDNNGLHKTAFSLLPISEKLLYFIKQTLLPWNSQKCYSTPLGIFIIGSLLIMLKGKRWSLPKR